ncbi:hypothetical protein STEG23_018650, partial [Scotinomys teguina]
MNSTLDSTLSSKLRKVGVKGMPQRSSGPRESRRIPTLQCSLLMHVLQMVAFGETVLTQQQKEIGADALSTVSSERKEQTPVSSKAQRLLREGILEEQKVMLDCERFEYISQVQSLKLENSSANI